MKGLIKTLFYVGLVILDWRLFCSLSLFPFFLWVSFCMTSCFFLFYYFFFLSKKVQLLIFFLFFRRKVDNFGIEETRKGSGFFKAEAKFVCQFRIARPYNNTICYCRHQQIMKVTIKPNVT